MPYFLSVAIMKTLLFQRNYGLCSKLSSPTLSSRVRLDITANATLETVAEIYRRTNILRVDYHILTYCSEDQTFSRPCFQVPLLTRTSHLDVFSCSEVKWTSLLNKNETENRSILKQVMFMKNNFSVRVNTTNKCTMNKSSLFALTSPFHFKIERLQSHLIHLSAITRSHT